MDEILVLDDGRIVERYTYEELLKANSLNKRMVEVQTQMLITSWAYSKRCVSAPFRSFVCSSRGQGNTARGRPLPPKWRLSVRGGAVSESEHLPAKSDEELVIETFVDRIEELHPNIDREEFHNTISGYVQEAVAMSDKDEGEEESEDEGE